MNMLRIRVRLLITCSVFTTCVAMGKAPPSTGKATKNPTTSNPQATAADQAAPSAPTEANSGPADAPPSAKGPLQEGDQIISGKNEPPGTPPNESPIPIYDPQWDRRQDEKTFDLRMQSASGHSSGRDLASEPVAIPGPAIINAGEVFTAPDGTQWEPVQITPEEAAKYPRNADGVVIIVAPQNQNQAISNSTIDAPPPIPAA